MPDLATVENRVKQKSQLRCDQHRRETDTPENLSKPGLSSESSNSRLVKSAMRTQEIPTRKYAMTRLGKGQYLLPSNDLTILWRIHSYEDGAFYGIVDCPYEARTFWRACWIPMDELERFPEAVTFSAWDPPWHEADWFLPTRKAAIDKAMKHDAERMADGA